MFMSVSRWWLKKRKKSFLKFLELFSDLATVYYDSHHHHAKCILPKISLITHAYKTEKYLLSDYN